MLRNKNVEGYGAELIKNEMKSYRIHGKQLGLWLFEIGQSNFPKCTKKKPKIICTVEDGIFLYSPAPKKYNLHAGCMLWCLLA